MKIFTKIISCSFLFIFITNTLFSQEALKSNEEDYYDFLSLLDLVERPVLNYRTLSDNNWILPENTEHLWNQNNLGSVRLFWETESPASNFFTNGINQSIKYKIFSPEWYNNPCFFKQKMKQIRMCRKRQIHLLRGQKKKTINQR